MTLDTELEREVRDAPSPSRTRVVVRRVVRVAWLLLLVAGLALALRARWTEVRTELATLHSGWLVLSALAGAAGVGVSAGIWHQMLRGVGVVLPLPVSLRIFFVGQIGKYLPGAVWPAVTQAGLARERGVAPRATVSAFLLFLWVHLVTGTIVAVAVLGVAGRIPRPTLLALPPLMLLLWPEVSSWCLRTLLRLLGRRPLHREPDAGHVAAAVGWALLMWALYGAHLQLLTLAVSDPVGPALTTGVFAASWVVGFVLLIAPAGVGPREAAMVALLPLPSGAALLVALVSRLALTGADAAWAAVTVVDWSRLRR